MGSVYLGSTKASDSRGFEKGFGFRAKDTVYAALIETADFDGRYILCVFQGNVQILVSKF